MVMQLVEEGALDLDKPVESYFPKPLAEYSEYRDLAGDVRAEEDHGANAAESYERIS